MKKIIKISQILFGSIIGLISCVGDTSVPAIAEVVSISGIGGSSQTVAFKIDILVEVKYKVFESINLLTKDLPITIPFWHF